MTKVKKKKFRFKMFFVILLTVTLLGYLLYLGFKYYVNDNTKNIYVIGNNILNDDEIIELAKLKDYPKFLRYTSSEMERRIRSNPYIKKVDVKKKINKSVYIYIDEYIPLFYNKVNNKLVLNNNSEVLLDEIFNNIPLLVNEVEDKKIYTKLIKLFDKINEDIKYKISEIIYKPNDVDKERFLFSMNDGNYVYITLNKIGEINYYLDVLPSLNEEKGILYLDSGNYFEKFVD